ncbi:MAG: DUF6496 domain-containing protein [Flavobacteriaceae bacterium]|nr:DUF6496 domain-containing protein [Flavobacteriaceae bacterium]
MAKYSKKAQEKIGEVMSEFKDGKLKSSSGDLVTDRKQAIAIGISEAEQAGYKVPKLPKDQQKPSSKKSGKKSSSKKEDSTKSASNKRSVAKSQQSSTKNAVKRS